MKAAVAVVAIACALIALPASAFAACRQSTLPTLFIGGANGVPKPANTNLFTAAPPANPFGAPPATHAVPITVAIKLFTDFPRQHQAVALDPPCPRGTSLLDLVMHGVKALNVFSTPTPSPDKFPH